MVKPTRVSNDIRRLRFGQGEMTQADLARQVGLTRQTIIAIEQGRYSPSLEVAFKISRVFGVSLEDVFHYPDDPFEETYGTDRSVSRVIASGRRSARGLARS